MSYWLRGVLFFFVLVNYAILKACDVKFFDLICFHFPRVIKNVYFRDGVWIFIVRSDLSNCPVKALEDYISAAQIDLSEDLPLFRSFAPPRSIERVRSQGISYTKARDLIEDAFIEFADFTKITSVHCLTNKCKSGENA